MDDPSMTMEEYFIIEEEKARKRGKVFNWQTATYGKIRIDDDLHDFSSLEAEFPAIVINDAFAPQDTFQCKSQVSTPINDEFDFRISFDESDDEDYTIIYDTNSFSYKMISVNNLKMDSVNDYEKVMPSIPSPELAISCFDDLDFFTDFENEFPAIVYNDAQTSKSDLLTEPILNPQHIDEFDLNDKTSLSEYYEEGQNVLYFNDLFPFNIIYMALPPREQRHKFLRYEGLEYPDTDIVYFEGRLTRIHMREVHRVLVFNFGGLPDLMAKGLTARMTMQHRDEAGVRGARMRMSWRQFILALGLHTEEEMQTHLLSPGLLDTATRAIQEHQTPPPTTLAPYEYQTALLEVDADRTTLRAETIGFPRALFLRYLAESAKHIPDKGDLRDYWMGISYAGDFLGTTSSYTAIRDSILRLCHRLIACSIAGRSQAPEKVTMTDLFYLRGMDVGSVNVPYLLVRYLRLFAVGRKNGAHISGGKFVARLADHFGLLTAEILGGLTVIAPELLVIDMAELVRLQISDELDDTWAWVAMGPERQPDAVAGAPADAEDAPIVDEGGQADPAPVQAPQ
ncbi:hypothetical protein Tco_0013785 [Tanacetum coccineum]